MNFEPYPFEKLRDLLKDIEPNNNFDPSDLTIGEPQFHTPQFIQDELSNSASFLNKYPKSAGEKYLKDAMINFNKKRFDIKLNYDQIIPVFGTREVLFNFPQFYLFDIQSPTIAFTNPFYQIYEGASIASRANIIHLDLLKENNFIPNINDKQLKKCDLVILNFPNNPTGAMIDIEELEKWVKKALEFDFVLINDECYSEIYTDQKPVSLLQASKNIGNKNFKNCLVLNSISKRSSAPGLRSGFIAGDQNILSKYMKYRTFVGCASPIPLQKTASLAWNDQQHVEDFRKIYTQNLKLAKDILNIDVPKATFYVWLLVNDPLNFTRNLYKEKNIKVLPGVYLSRGGAGDNYIRIALVENNEKTKKVLQNIKNFIDNNQKG